MYDKYGKLIVGDDIFFGEIPQKYLTVEMPYSENGKTFLRAGDGSINVIEDCDIADKGADECKTKEDAFKKLLTESGNARELCKKYGISYSENRRVIAAETHGDVSSYINILVSSFDGNGIFTVPLSKYRIAVVCSEENISSTELASALSATFADMNTDHYIGIGSLCENASELRLSFEQALSAIEVGKKLSYTGGIWSFADVLPEVIVSKLPQNAIESIKTGAMHLMHTVDSENIELAEAFFKNNLNISETARNFYLHRNTLIYRLDKIYRETGFDLRKFDEAVAFRLCIAVNRITKQG